MRQEVAAALHETAESIEACVAILERMGERCDPYIYNERVRTFMSGWTHEAMPPEGLAYEGVLPAPTETTSPAPSAPSLSRTSLGFKLKSIMKRFQRAPSTESPLIGPESAEDGSGTKWRVEQYFGETGAQSSLFPALDAAFGIGMSEDKLLPYLMAMRLYMPPEHASFIAALERGPKLMFIHVYPCLQGRF